MMAIGMPGPWEVVLILLIVVIIFGAGKVPEIGRSMGKGLNEFKKAFKGGNGKMKG